MDDLRSVVDHLYERLRQQLHSCVPRSPSLTYQYKHEAATTDDRDSLFAFESTADFTNFNSEHILKVCIEDSQLKKYLLYFFTLVLKRKV
ncbi:hypothetical protein [Anabaena azotica]|uniref:Uncharacterized protein n=1 Tax=Anabaena azotica FACHB-119 TaxID=947527 RepID=A0ABR8DCH5_9NOST|nr:hypothetical protein [Anabaena azotica]MBD2504065.1 hypothetical protein [Anabaena azotica FACHB-119]